ncbi:hypothetical protein [Curtobacterium ammoniigenes]|uniref:hypothetical protein n=1 Tax=Curtobacterium ammoniigenes TaxID=395387 RepID=UPI000834FFCD|nr:hypothetical protein [Curtobacterium ammoniigenes]
MTTPDAESLSLTTWIDRLHHDADQPEHDTGEVASPVEPASIPAGQQASTEPQRIAQPLTRRTALTLAAVAVPAIAVSAAAPAAAASANATIEIVAPASASIGDDINSQVRVTVRSQGGVPLPNEPVIVSVSPTTVGSFPGNGGAYSGSTNANGVLTLSGLTLKAAGTLTFSASNSGHVATATANVAAVDPAAIAFSSPSYSGAAGSQITVGGLVFKASNGYRPSAVSLNYTGGFSGPASVPVEAATAKFTASVTAPNAAGSGTVTASAPDATSDSATLTATGSAFAFVFEIYNANNGSWNPLDRPQISYIVGPGGPIGVVQCRYRFTSTSAPRAVTYDGSFSPYTVPSSVTVSSGIAAFTVQIPAAGGPTIARGILLDGTPSGQSLQIQRGN